MATVRGTNDKTFVAVQAKQHQMRDIEKELKTNEPKSTRLKLLVSNLVDIETEDRSTNIKYYINSSYVDITNIRLYNRTINTDKQDTILNQYVVQESHICDIIDNAEGQLRYPYVGSTR